MKFPIDPRLPIVTTDIREYATRLNQRLYDLFRELAKAINAMSDGFLLTTTTVDGDYTANAADQLLLVDNTTDVTVTLPPASETENKRFIVKKISNNTFPVYVTAESGNIDDDTTIVIDVAYTSLDFVSDGSNYWMI